MSVREKKTEVVSWVGYIKFEEVSDIKKERFRQKTAT